MKGTPVVFILPSQWRGQDHGSHWFQLAKKVVAGPRDLPLLPLGALWVNLSFLWRISADFQTQFDVPTDEEVISSDASNSNAFLSADEGTGGESPTAPVVRLLPFVFISLTLSSSRRQRPLVVAL